MVEGTPPGDALPPPPQASNAGPQGRTLWGRCWVPAPAPTAPGTHGSRSPGCPLQPWLPAPEDGRPGEGQRLTPSAPHNGGRPPPPGTAPHHPRGMQPPQGGQGRGDRVGPPHPHTRAHSTWWRTPTARLVGGQSGEGRRLSSDAPHNGGRHAPRGRPSATPSQRATPAHKGARCGAGAGSTRPHQPHPGHTGRGRHPWLPASRGRAAGEGQRLTAGAPHNGGRPPPAGTAPHHPRGTHAPTGHAGQRDSVGPPHATHQPHPGQHVGRGTPTARSRGRAVRGRDSA